MTLPVLPTTVIGSLPKPAWLTDAWYTVTERWHPQGAALAEAQADATRLALLDQHAAGIDIVADGEQRRSTHYTYFLRGVDGIDSQRLAPKSMRAGKFTQDVPRVVGPLGLRAHLAVDDYRFLRALTTKPIKMTLPGPSTLVDGTADEHYGDERALAMAYADVLNAEIRALAEAGCTMVQLDEPVFTRIPWKLASWGVDAMDRAFAGTTVTSVVHVCYGYGARLGTKEWKHGYDAILPHLARARNVQQYSLEFAEPALSSTLLVALGDKTVQLGVIDCGRDEVESPDTVAARLRAALAIVPAERLVAAPDCGLVARGRAAARAKLAALVAGTRRVRDDL